MPAKTKNHKEQPFWIQFVDLFLMEIGNWGQSWPIILLGGTLASLFFLVSLGIFARDNGPQALAYVLAGNVITSLLFGTMGVAQSRFTLMKLTDLLEYYATQPIRRYALIMAVAASALLLAIPSLLIVIVVGSRLFDVSLNVHSLAWVVVPLSTLPFAAVGSLVGVSTNTFQESNTIHNVLILALTFFGAVTFPPELLPETLIILGRFNPATYAASAVRQLLLGPVTIQLSLDLIVMASFTVLVYWFVGQRMDWRQV